VSNTYQKKPRRAQPDPMPAEVVVPEQVIVSVGEIAGRRRRACWPWRWERACR
jgi:hypothetical protein